MSKVGVYGGRTVYHFNGKKYVEAMNANERAIAQLIVGRHLLLEIEPSFQENPMEPTQPESQECILDIAKKLTRGDRNASYGHPSQDFIRTAGMMNALFGDMLKEGCKFEPQHIAMMMILVKLSRQRHQNKRDNWIDIAGYSDCGDRCSEVKQ